MQEVFTEFNHEFGYYYIESYDIIRMLQVLGGRDIRMAYELGIDLGKLNKTLKRDGAEALLNLTRGLLDEYRGLKTIYLELNILIDQALENLSVLEASIDRYTRYVEEARIYRSMVESNITSISRQLENTSIEFQRHIDRIEDLWNSLVNSLNDSVDKALVYSLIQQLITEVEIETGNDVLVNLSQTVVDNLTSLNQSISQDNMDYNLTLYNETLHLYINSLTGWFNNLMYRYNQTLDSIQLYLETPEFNLGEEIGTALTQLTDEIGAVEFHQSTLQYSLAYLQYITYIFRDLFINYHSAVSGIELAYRRILETINRLYSISRELIEITYGKLFGGRITRDMLVSKYPQIYEPFDKPRDSYITGLDIYNITVGDRVIGERMVISLDGFLYQGYIDIRIYNYPVIEEINGVRYYIPKTMFIHDLVMEWRWLADVVEEVLDLNLDPRYFNTTFIVKTGFYYLDENGRAKPFPNSTEIEINGAKDILTNYFNGSSDELYIKVSPPGLETAVYNLSETLFIDGSKTRSKVFYIVSTENTSIYLLYPYTWSGNTTYRYRIITGYPTPEYQDPLYLLTYEDGVLTGYKLLSDEDKSIDTPRDGVEPPSEQPGQPSDEAGVDIEEVVEAEEEALNIGLIVLIIALAAIAVTAYLIKRGYIGPS